VTRHRLPSPVVGGCNGGGAYRVALADEFLVAVELKCHRALPSLASAKAGSSASRSTSRVSRKR
jgi:acetyl-CoA carboxylase carboxyltransferase component